MEYFVSFIVAAMIIYWISKRFSKKEAQQFYEENTEPKEAQNIDTVDPAIQCLVTFLFKSNSDQFMINSFPNINIFNENYKLVNDELTLKLPPQFTVTFGVPYLKTMAFKVTQQFDFRAGYRYSVLFKPRMTVMQKAKVIISELGPI